MMIFRGKDTFRLGQEIDNLVRNASILKLPWALEYKDNAKGTTDPRYWVLWLNQHIHFKAEASSIFVKL